MKSENRVCPAGITAAIIKGIDIRLEREQTMFCACCAEDCKSQRSSGVATSAMAGAQIEPRRVRWHAVRGCTLRGRAARTEVRRGVAAVAAPSAVDVVVGATEVLAEAAAQCLFRPGLALRLLERHARTWVRRSPASVLRAAARAQAES